MYEELSRLEEHYLRCVRCGQCRSVCPVFNETRTETTAPRGKVFIAHMLASGEIPAGPEADRQLSLCLLCQACSRECPSAIPVHKIVVAARSLLARKKPSPLRKLIYREIWSRPALFSLSAGFVRRCQGFGLLDLLINTGVLSRGFLIPGMLPSRPARSFLPEVTPAAGRPHRRIGYFLGCSTNHLFPGLAANVVGSLSRLGCEVVVPRDLKCCGLPQLAGGQGETALVLAADSFNSFNRLGVEAVVTDCASCSSALKEFSSRGDHPGLQILDLSALLAELIEHTSPVLRPLTQVVTYHDPCHLARAQGLTANPRELLRLACTDFREMPGASDCCGGGGAFALGHYQISRGILARKVSSIKETGAQLVATFCPSCLMQLRHGLAENGSGAAAVHVVDLLARSLGINEHFLKEGSP